ncbi:MAG: hypothetical protein NTX28_12960 [Novosphingobium sp.]|nr:hypothetical protein [Novosphingobium sp.]
MRFHHRSIMSKQSPFAKPAQPVGQVYKMAAALVRADVKNHQKPALPDIGTVRA